MTPDEQSTPKNISADQTVGQPASPAENSVEALPQQPVPVTVAAHPEPVAPTNMDQPTSTVSQPPTSTGKSPIKKIGMVPAIIVAIVLLISAGAAAYVGVIVPNKPENVWKTALTNTSNGLDKLVSYTKEQKDIKGAKANGSFKFESDGIVVDGTFDGAYYEKNSKWQADVGAAGSRVKVDVLTHVPDGATSPDVYARVNGLAGLSSVLNGADPSTSKYLSTIDNQWYVVDHTLFDQLQKSATKAKDETPTLSQEDIYTIEDVVTKTSKEYLFSTDESKAVLKVSTFVGKEEIDGRKVYHYEVSINKENTKAYLTALKDGLKATKLGETYNDPSFEEAIGFDDLLKEVDSIDENKVFDAWVDRSTKTIRKVSFTNEEKKSHLDVSLNYEGGSSYPFVIGLYTDEGDDKGSVILSLTLNTDTNTVNMGLNADMSNTKTEVKVNVEKNDSQVEFTKPNDAKSFYQLLGPLSPALGSEIPTSVLGDSTIDQFIQ